jgi:hypothetical protein
MTEEQPKRGLPFPDPFGLLEALTDGAFFDPILSRPQSQQSPEQRALQGLLEGSEVELQRLEDQYERTLKAIKDEMTNPQFAHSYAQQHLKTLEDTIKMLKIQVRQLRRQTAPDLLSMDQRVQAYVDLLKDAYAVAPCVGCKRLVESAIVGARVYQDMEREGMRRSEMDQSEIDRIKREVSEDLQGVS